MGKEGREQGEDDSRKKKIQHLTDLCSLTFDWSLSFILYFLNISKLSPSAVPAIVVYQASPFPSFPSSYPLTTFLSRFLRHHLGHADPIFKNPSAVLHRWYNKAQTLRQAKSIIVGPLIPSLISSLDFSHKLFAPAVEPWVAPHTLPMLPPLPLHHLLCFAKSNVLSPQIRLANKYLLNVTTLVKPSWRALFSPFPLSKSLSWT